MKYADFGHPVDKEENRFYRFVISFFLFTPLDFHVKREQLQRVTGSCSPARVIRGDAKGKLSGVAGRIQKA